MYATESEGGADSEVEGEMAGGVRGDQGLKTGSVFIPPEQPRALRWGGVV